MSATMLGNDKRVSRLCKVLGEMRSIKCCWILMLLSAGCCSCWSVLGLNSVELEDII